MATQQTTGPSSGTSLATLQEAVAECTRRLSQARADIAALEEERRRLLIAGDDKALELIDTRIAAAARSIAREEDRLAALEPETARAREAAEGQDLQRLISKAHAARAAGEKLILDAYPKAARKLSDLLAAIAAIDVYIGRVNDKARAAGIDPAPLTPLNHVRTQPSVTIPATVVTEEFHDLSVQPVRVTGDYAGSDILESQYRMKTIERKIPEQVITYSPPYETLPATCVLPAARGGEREVWRDGCQAHREAVARAEQLVEELLR